MAGSYKLDDSEKKVLDFITSNINATPKEIAKHSGLDEQTAKRLYNRLFAEDLCSQMIVPNYALLGYKVMIVQKLKLNTTLLPDAHFIISKIESEWKNCIDCHETFDGQLYVRSVWKNAEEFKNARGRLRHLQGVDWLAGEEVDMVPLVEGKRILNVRSLWDDVEDSKSEK